MKYQEIERKFRVLRLPEDLERFPSSRIQQGYLTLPGELSTIRVRKMDEGCFLTVKQSRKKGSLLRDEVEMPIDENYFQPLWNLTEGRRIEKRRYFLPWQEYTIELDLFEGNLQGLVLAEVEFESEEKTDNLPLPSWFGEELSRDFRYTNSHLAFHGIPKQD